MRLAGALAPIASNHDRSVNAMDWSYDAWPSGEPYEWAPAERGHSAHDAHDFHVDLGCGKLKKGRIGIDRYPAPGVNIVMDLDALAVYGLPEQVGDDTGLSDAIASASFPGERHRILSWGLPFPDNSIKSIISHHALEHIGGGFIALIDEVYRVLEPGGLFRAITPLFPSRTAVEDPDHVRYFMVGTWEMFCGRPEPGGHWAESFSVPYTKARFEKIDSIHSPPVPVHEMWGEHDAREIRVMLRAVK